MAMSVMASASLFSVFTYITPLLREVTGLTPKTAAAVLLLFGAGITVGNFIGGRLGDLKLMPPLVGIFLTPTFAPCTFALNRPMSGARIGKRFFFGVFAFF